MIQNVGKGALPDLPDDRDFRADPILSASAPVDWSKEFRLPNPGDEDQGTSSSCVAQAFSYYHNQINPAAYSRRDLYSRIAQPQGGAYLRDGAAAIVGQGQATRDEVADPFPQTEANMRAGAGTAAQQASHGELNYFSIASRAIDAVAQAVRDYKGAVFGVNGSNEGWRDMANPRPPLPSESIWGHALYLMGYHMHNGKKCLIAKSSWCRTYTPGQPAPITEHHITEDYINSGNTFSAWTLIPKAKQKIVARLVSWHDSPEQGLYFPFDSIERKLRIIEGVEALFPDYKVEPTIVNLGKKTF